MTMSKSVSRVLVTAGLLLGIAASSQQINAENLLLKKNGWQLENVKGRVKALEVKSYKPDNNDPQNPLHVLQQTVTSIYSDKGFLLSKQTVNSVNVFENRKLIVKQYLNRLVSLYNSEDQLVSEKKFVGLVDVPIDSAKMTRTEYQYADGKISVSDYNNFGKLSSLYEIFPAKESSPVHAVRMSYGGSATNKREEFIYTYNAAKQLLKIQVSRNEQITAIQEFEYSGRNLTKKSYQSGTSLDAGGTEYKYNQQGDISSEIQFSSRSGAEVSNFVYTYDRQKNWTKKEKKDKAGNLIGVEERKITYY